MDRALVTDGERRRADICVAQALRDPSRSYGKMRLFFAAFDERFDSSFNPERVASVTDLLEKVAK